MDVEGNLDSIICNVPLFAIEFHPHRPLIAASTIDGNIILSSYSNKGHEKLLNLSLSEHSCRCMSFSLDGNFLYTGLSDHSVAVVDIVKETVCTHLKTAHEAAVNSIKVYDDQFVVSGDDEGFVKIWDHRLHKELASSISLQEHGDSVTGFYAMPDRESLLVTSSDGTLSVYDFRKNKLGNIFAMSELQDSELLGVTCVKGGDMIACNTNTGHIKLFKYGVFGVPETNLYFTSSKGMSKTFKNSSMDTICSISKNVVACGFDNGIVGLASIKPDRILGISGFQGDAPIECIACVPPTVAASVLDITNNESAIFASCAIDGKITFWDSLNFVKKDHDASESDEGDEGDEGDEKNERDIDINNISSQEEDDDSDIEWKHSRKRMAEKTKKRKVKERKNQSKKKRNITKVGGFFDGL